MKNLKVTILAFCFVIIGCENASETAISVPNVQVGCTTGDSGDCDSGNVNTPTAFVVMTRSGCSESSIQFDPVATGSSTMSCDTDGCDVTISSWTNPGTSEPVTEILTGTMDVCSRVDLDGSGSSTPTTGDLVNDSSRSISSGATITVDSW
ncbi:MAG: hypothetical protein AAF203_05125 [Pseudomonadota bacterium]